MEPFGLFELLKTLLPTTAQTAEPPPQSPAPGPQNPAPVANENTRASEQTNACWEFMTKHDERARNVKKRTP